MVTRPAGDPAFEDLTARARIRDAALRLFADRGIDGATVRDIAKEAGVSLGLVRHHFGSKQALREACDSYALDQAMSLKEQVIFEGQVANPTFMAMAHPTLLLMMRYFARSLLDGSPAAAGLFDRMVELGEEWIKRVNPEQSMDPRGYSAVLVAMQSGLLMMSEHVSRAFGTEVHTPEGHLRMVRASLDVFARPLLDAETATKAYEAIDNLRARTRPTSPVPPTAAEGA